MVVVRFGVPLLSQEGPTCRLLPGATAPYPTPGQALTKFPAVVQELTKLVSPSRFVFVLVVETVVQAVRPLQALLTRLL